LLYWATGVGFGGFLFGWASGGGAFWTILGPGSLLHLVDDNDAALQFLSSLNLALVSQSDVGDTRVN
jgi:hypothetical protein